MEINNLSEDLLADLFSDKPGDPLRKINFESGLEDIDTDINGSVIEETTLTPVDEEENPETPKEDEVDILEDKKPGRKPKYSFEDTSGYFADRIKSGKFLAVEEELEDGKKELFIPKTPEEFDEFIDIQVNTKVENAQKQLEQSWYESKTPAWKAVAKYAEMIDDPSELVPFITGVSNIQSVQNIDENEIDGAEQIVRIRLQQRGEDQDVIEDQIESLKSTDKLVSTAKKFKPVILQQEAQYLQAEMTQKQEQEKQYMQMISSIREKAINVIEAPMFGKTKLKNEEKAIVYEMIGAPSLETGGYKIYNAIDNLFEQGKFDVLAKVALLLGKEDSFMNYVSNNAAHQTAAQLERKLRVSTEGQSSQSDYQIPEDVERVQRKKFNSKFGFGS